MSARSVPCRCPTTCDRSSNPGSSSNWARRDQLERLGARYTEQRVVEHGRVITAAGVSSAIDMALTLLDRMYGPPVAQSVQLAIEYNPQPPFDAGTPSKAPAEILELATAALQAPAEASAQDSK